MPKQSIDDNPLRGVQHEGRAGRLAEEDAELGIPLVVGAAHEGDNHYTPSPGAYDVRKEAVEARVPAG